MAQFPPHDLGLALSGGGSRAAAFHRGTLRALLELGVLPRVDVVSTVSGGSLFGAAWMAARAGGESDEQFLRNMRVELGKGFIRRSVRPSLLKALVPFTGFSRTDLIAETFDEAFFRGRTLSDLPQHPALCLNVTVLNNGQVGKFARDGFSAPGIRVPDASPSHVVPWDDFPLALAVAASAAFPVGLPPVVLKRSDLPSGARLEGTLAGADRLSLTDGGVLENLGIQTLLRSQRFAAWNLVVSDAGTRDQQWSPSAWSSLKGFGIWTLSGRILDRLMLVMNDKQNRWARQQVIEALQQSWLAGEARAGNGPSPGLSAFLAGADTPARRRRDVLFARVNQDWASFILSIRRYRMVELAVAAGRTPDDAPDEASGAAEREAFFDSIGTDLSTAREIHDEMGGEAAAHRANEVATNFTALSSPTVDLLDRHAAWQIHAAHAIYGL